MSPARDPQRVSRSSRVAAVLRGLPPGVRARLRGRDLMLIAAGLTFYAGIAVVPLLVLSFGLTAWITSPERVRELGERVGDLLPSELGAPAAVDRLVEAGAGLDPLGALLALLPMSLYGEGLRRALLRFSERHEGHTAWRGRLAALPLLLLAPVLLYPLLLAAAQMADLADRGGVAATIGQVALGYYAVLAALTLPLAWGFRVVGGGRARWRSLLVGALFTAACLSGFLQGFVLFLALPLDLGAPFGDLDVVGGVVALALWLFLLHLVALLGWLTTQTLDELAGDRSAPRRRVGEPVEPGVG
ncbi:membrane protein [Blastococcus sp. DSM 46786]|uniref:YhjD/YihY/BrkB family envelope integrity protein n=1 Tax=Blastococcus sp. DSM 46786 TaxID=1798227 RepID=UPI0008C8FD6A|nr:YhjD/YihY/BrkB family envelope integrity protein [Blastococcus sp. DSM 46786]SEK91134.1 membrane protein [Blastococcus sp. DSM 46786]